MKIVGTIVEYNPLHNGHIYALNEIKKQSQADLLVVVLSGNCTMRGDISIFDKFEKTKQALIASIDIVIELPFVCAVQNSDGFAKNAIDQLHLAGVQEIWIGSETNQPALYEEYYNIWVKDETQIAIKNLVNQGKSYKEATAKVIHLPSNDLLGFCYYKAIREAKYEIKLYTIQRIGNFNSLEANQFASAYAIRSDLSLMKSYCPSFVNPKQIRKTELFFYFLKYKILSTSLTELRTIFFVDEGIEHRLLHIDSFNCLEEYINYLSTKRYTKSRIQRMLLYILFNITKDRMSSLPKYKMLRVLGYSDKGKKYLNQIKKTQKIYTNIKEGIHPVLDIELKITKIIDILYASSTFKNEQGKPIEYKK